MKKYKDFELDYGENGDISIVDGDFRVEINPQSNEKDDKARIVIITEEKYYNEDILETYCSEQTCLIIPESVDSSGPCEDTEKISEEAILDVFGVKLHVINQGEGFSYLINMRGIEFFVASRVIEMRDISKDLESVNIAFLPFKDSDEISNIIKMAVTLKPDYFIPNIYGDDIEETDLRALTSELDQRNIPQIK